MKPLYLLALLAASLLPASPAHALLVGKLDLARDPEAIIVRELQEGMWLGGAQKQLWHLERRECNADVCGFVEVFHIGVFAASRLEGNQTAYGPALGFPIGAPLALLADKVQFIAAASDAAPPFLKKIADWTSVDAYAGYRPELSGDATHHFIYGIGGKVRIPLSILLSWAKGTDGQKGL